ncbi:hypothetical protein N4G62_14825 [Sphingomonas sanguinis]|uniref:Uncharacterized protein n=2 Tax=Pseudomonadota TaxID=1224 RepID=A0ABU5LTP1_9SPHN|nr:MULTISPECIES: hypothetical protein [Pseudomonadota]MDZ7280386.1 hypothetical protein [Pantoea eucrina]MDZ7283299.1 hypothetical protein [Sphingomonas sanguinis]
MKLIDLLVQELPKRGGWPDGAIYICAEEDGVPRIVGSGWHDNKSLSSFKVNADKSIVDSNQYESALAASQKPAWNGEGLPPVGCECEVKRAFDWVKCKILFISDTHVVLMADEECCWNTCACQFRPLRTEAERKRDEAVVAMQREADEGDNWIYSEYEIIYDAIAAGKIPGVKLDD